MAWFVTPRLRFLHVPKTGGSWATDAMCAAGVPAVHPEASPVHATLASTGGYADRFTFAFVRHPLEYWRSYWAYRMRTGWNPLDRIDQNAGSERFEEFIEGVITVAPGAASTLFEQFVGPPGAEISFVGHHERLIDDVCLALRIAGETFDEYVLRSYPKVNTSDSQLLTEACYPPSLAKRLAEVEQPAIQRFFPWEPVPSGLLVAKERSRAHDPLAIRLADTAIELRDTKAELNLARDLLRSRNVELRDVRRDLHQLQRSRLQRWTRPLRRYWYHYRPRMSR